MQFSLGDAITEAFERLTTSAGAIFVVVLTVIGIIQTAAIQDLIRAMLEGFLAVLNDPEFREQVAAEDLQELEAAEQEINTVIGELSLSVGLSPGLAALVLLLAFILSIVIVVVAIDTFTNRRDSLGGIQTPRIGWKTLNLFVGWIAFGILFVIGLILLVIPGILVGIFLVFFAAAIVIDDESFISAFASSFQVVRSNIAGTLGLVLLLLGTFIGLGFVGSAFGVILPEILSVLVSNLLTGIGQVFAIALVALAYADATTEDPQPVDTDPTGFTES
ncbi:hypothetical protein [Natronorubrum sp. A-ect3]|uniref:hypothetical protein n=1 Tax=Natronorubrum sp. A-ect3 TaxID=3242698 RepID=UPI00359D69D2